LISNRLGTVSAGIVDFLLLRGWLGGWFLNFWNFHTPKACKRPLTRPAPADENAGGRPPSPLRRGL
jgi:hypothetical protein